VTRELESVRHLLAFVYKQVQPMLRKNTNPGKLYLSTQDGFFLPPNAKVGQVVLEGDVLRLLSW